jgi:hypothetical protein
MGAIAPLCRPSLQKSAGRCCLNRGNRLGPTPGILALSIAKGDAMALCSRAKANQQ